MRRILPIPLLLLVAFALPGQVTAQSADKTPGSAKAAEPALHFYRLEFLVQELDTAGKPVNSRNYTTTVNTRNDFSSSIRTGSKIPIATGSSANAVTSSLVNTQFQYVDVGVNFDIDGVREVGNQLSLRLKAEVSSVASRDESPQHQPVIRQNSWHAPVLVPVGKPTVVFRSDSLDSKGAMEVTLTATPIS